MTMWHCPDCGGTFQCFCPRPGKAPTPAEPVASGPAVGAGRDLAAHCDRRDGLDEEPSNGRNSFEELLAELTRPSLLRLHMGEMTAQEMRTAKAAVRFTLAKCADLAPLPKGWLVQGEATHLYVPGAARPNFVFINGHDPVVSIEALYDRAAPVQ